MGKGERGEEEEEGGGGGAHQSVGSFPLLLALCLFNPRHEGTKTLPPSNAILLDAGGGSPEYSRDGGLSNGMTS